MGNEPIDKLSEVLLNLQDFHSENDAGAVRRTMALQIDVLLDVQAQMQVQLQVHDAQIASLREVIAMLNEKGK